MFQKLLKFPQFRTLIKTTLFCSLISFKIKCQTISQNVKTINEKDFNAALQNPKYFSNTIIVLNKTILEDLPQTLQVKLCYYDGELSEYDLVAINQHRCLLLKIRSEEDYLRLQNFFTPITVLQNKQEAIDLINQTDAKAILSYIPSPPIGKQAEETINKFDTFKQYNHKDPNELEEQFREMRYLDINREAHYYMIRDKQVAEQFNLSQNDIGEVYVLKGTSIFNSKESSFVHDQKEFCMTKVEPDPNLENADQFKQLTKHNSIQDIIAEPISVPTQKLDLLPFVQRLSLLSNNYVNYIYNKQQMDSQLILYKQIGIQYILIYGTENEIQEKTIRKLINVKKSMNTLEQQKLGIICSDNADLLQQYFGIVSNKINDEIRLLDLNSHQSYLQQFNIIQLGQNIKKYNQYKHSKRYYFGDKITVNRLKYFLTQTTQLKINNIDKPIENRQEYYEKTQVRIPLENIETITSEKMNLSQFDFIYFYKPGCAACNTLSETLDKIADRLKHPNPYRVKHLNNFKLIQLKKYNILNESQLLPSPNKAPTIAILKDGKVYPGDLLQNRIDPRDEEKVLHFLTKIIDNLI